VGPAQRIGDLAAALGRASGVGVRAVVSEEADTIAIEISSDDPAFLWGEQGEVFDALEHVIRRLAVRFAEGRRIVIRDQAHRERRDAALRERARAVAAAVRRDGRTQEMRDLNSYERRVIHLALEGEAGVRTRSVGSGEGRTLLVESAEADGA
jgi:spoIIIJ-associated protein